MCEYSCRYISFFHHFFIVYVSIYEHIVYKMMKKEILLQVLVADPKWIAPVEESVIDLCSLLPLHSQDSGYTV